MRLYSCWICRRIYTEWELKYGGYKGCPVCKSYSFVGASPSFWKLLFTLQIFRVYYHAWRWQYER